MGLSEVSVLSSPFIGFEGLHIRTEVALVLMPVPHRLIQLPCPSGHSVGRQQVCPGKTFFAKRLLPLQAGLFATAQLIDLAGVFSLYTRANIHLRGLSSFPCSVDFKETLCLAMHLKALLSGWPVT